jgi:MFS family permease
VVRFLSLCDARAVLRLAVLPPGNDTAALLSAFATYAAGFLVRLVRPLIFGRIGDLVGRKYTFLVTIVVMGLATFLVGLLPRSPRSAGSRPVLLVTLRLCQGLALGANAAARRPMWPSIPAGGTRLHHELHLRPRRRSAFSWHWS